MNLETKIKSLNGDDKAKEHLLNRIKVVKEIQNKFPGKLFDSFLEYFAGSYHSETSLDAGLRNMNQQYIIDLIKDIPIDTAAGVIAGLTREFVGSPRIQYLQRQPSLDDPEFIELAKKYKRKAAFSLGHHHCWNIFNNTNKERLQKRKSMLKLLNQEKAIKTVNIYKGKIAGSVMSYLTHAVDHKPAEFDVRIHALNEPFLKKFANYHPKLVPEEFFSKLCRHGLKYIYNLGSLLQNTEQLHSFEIAVKQFPENVKRAATSALLDKLKESTYMKLQSEYMVKAANELKDVYSEGSAMFIHMFQVVDKDLHFFKTCIEMIKEDKWKGQKTVQDYLTKSRLPAYDFKREIEEQRSKVN